MIKITRINGKSLFLNAEIIETVEATPDTVITLVGGKTVMVAESVAQIIRRINFYRRKIHSAKRKIEKKKP